MGAVLDGVHDLAVGRAVGADALERMWEELGLTFVMVTHDSAIAQMAPRPATIRKGRISVKENTRAYPPDPVTEFRRPCNSRPTEFLPPSRLLST